MRKSTLLVALLVGQLLYASLEGRAQKRMEYEQGKLEKEDLHSSPLMQLQLWLAEATEATLVEPSAMVLSTVGKSAQPSSRTVLLREISEEGLLFYTHYGSRKGREIASNPHAVALLLWTPLERQVIVEGSITKVSRTKSEEYFASRPRMSQIAAWASSQDQPIENRSTLNANMETAKERFRGQPVPCPPEWGGYVLKPTRVEFWQGGKHRLHDRLVYVLKEGVWQVRRLSP